MKKHLPTNSPTFEQPDLIARYFIRRLALAHRKWNKPSVQYNNALADTVGVFVAFPLVAFASFILILSLRWAPNTVAKVFGLSPGVGMIMIVVFSMVVGYLWLNGRLKKYREDRSIYLRFATESDRRVVFWQKIIVFVVCAIVIPFLALLVTFGTQVITKAFD